MVLPVRFELMPKVHDRVMTEYAKSGVTPDALAAESLTRAQESPTEDVIDRINEISREVAPSGYTEGERPERLNPITSEEKPEPADLPPATLRPAVREADGEIRVGGEGEYHQDIVDRTGKDEERGFVDRDGQFHTRDEAKARLREDDPKVYQLCGGAEAGGPDEEFHTTDYNEALRKSTGIKNASVDAQREQRGLAPLSQTPQQHVQMFTVRAKADVDSVKVDPLRIAESVNANPRGISDSETIFNYYNAQLSKPTCRCNGRCGEG